MKLKKHFYLQVRLFSIAILITSFAFNNLNAQTPVAYYPFTGNANDAVGTNHGTAVGASLTTDRLGNLNSAYSFDGINDMISFFNLGSTQIDNFTLSAWVKPATLNQWGYIVVNGDENPLFGNGWALLQRSTLQIGGMTGAYISGHYPYASWLQLGENFTTANIWYHIALVRDGGVSKFYLNGVSNGSVSSNSPFTPTGSLSIGAANPGNYFFNGVIDEVKIYNTALTATQIEQDYINSASSLIAYYPFTGNSADSSGYANHGTVNGATLTTDRFGNANSAYSFNGTSNYIEVPSSTSLQSPGITNAITQTAWVKPIVASTITMKSTGGSFSYSMGMNMSTIGQNYNDYAVNYGSSFTFIPNTWYFVAVTFDGSTMSNYVNGILLSTAVSTHTISSNTSPLVIGADFPGFVEYFQGDIDELKIYNTALTATQIEQNYINSASSLIAYYPFTGNSADSSGYANHGTVNGATLTADRFGNANSAYSFNGTSNYIEVPSSVSLQSPSITNAITQTAWIKPIGGNTITMKSNTSSGPSSYGMGFDIDALIQMYNNYSNNLRSSYTFIPNTWYFVAVTYDGFIMKNYINGNLISSSVSNHTISSNSLPLIIGADYFGIIEYYQGDIDELKIYNTALTATQIANEYGTSVFSTSAGANDICNPYNSSPSISTGTPYATSGYSNINTHSDTIKQNNLSASYQTGEPIASCGSAGISNKTTWTKFVAPKCATPQIIISTDDRSTTNFDSRVSAYRRVSPSSCTGGYTEIACSDNDIHPSNIGATNNSTILLSPASGTPTSNQYVLGETVYIQTSGVGSASGDYGLIIDLEPYVPITTTVGSGSAVVDWSAISAMGTLTGAYIQWRAVGSGPTVAGTWRYVTGATNTTITGLTPGVAYEYWASYVCTSGGRWWSKKGTFTTSTSCTGGIAPSIVSVVAGSTSCNKPVVSFNATALEYSSYKIARRRVGTSTITYSSTFYPSASTQTYTNGTLVLGASYEFWIVGYCGSTSAITSPITTYTVCSSSRQANPDATEQTDTDKDIVYIMPNGDMSYGLASNQLPIEHDINNKGEQEITLQTIEANQYFNGDISSATIETKVGEMSIYPNPATSEATISYTLEKETTIMIIRVIDAQGKEIMNETITNPEGSGIYNINLINYSAGIYFVKIQSGDFLETKKLIVRKK